MITLITHVALEPEGLIQKCERCGYVLSDYTGSHAVTVGHWSPGFWHPGDLITVTTTDGKRGISCVGPPDLNARPCDAVMH